MISFGNIYEKHTIHEILACNKLFCTFLKSSFIFGCAGSLHRFFSSCGAWASHCSGFSRCRAWVLGCVGFRSCSSQVREHRLIVVAHGFSFSLACGIFWTRNWTHVSCIGRWIFTTEPPGKPYFVHFVFCFLYFVFLAQNSLSSSFSTWEDSRLSLNGGRRE